MLLANHSLPKYLLITVNVQSMSRLVDLLSDCNYNCIELFLLTIGELNVGAASAAQF